AHLPRRGALGALGRGRWSRGRTGQAADERRRSRAGSARAGSGARTRRRGRRGRGSDARRQRTQPRLQPLGQQRRFVMGRVYDALKRAAESGGAGVRRNGTDDAAARAEKTLASVAETNGRNGTHAAAGGATIDE